MKPSSTNLHNHDCGADIADILNLKKNKDGTYPTTWGNKSEYGLYLTVETLIKEYKER